MIIFSQAPAFHKLGFISFFNESPLKIMKKAFYFVLKALLVLGYLNFGPEYLIMKKIGKVKG